jgi:hypothetical protein
MNTIINGTDNQKPEKKSRHWDLRIAMILLCVLLLHLNSEDSYNPEESQNASIQELTEALKAQKNDIEVLAQYQTNLTQIIVGMVNVLSNQTQSIKDLRNIAEIQMMSISDPYSIPATNSIEWDNK